ncbi:MAG: hypothetical protein ABI949_17155 [Ilumatobacteraceae bacterium]
MTRDEATEAIVRMARPAIESRAIGELHDGFEFTRLIHDQAMTRDDFALITRLMLDEIVALAQKADVISVAIGPVVGDDGDLLWRGIEWLT